MVSHTAAGVQQNEEAKNPEIWVEAIYVVMAVHGLIRLADGLRLPLEFEEGSRRRPLVSIPDDAGNAELLGEIAEFFGMERAPGVFRALARRGLYLKVTWSWIRQVLEPGLLTRERKTLIALAVSITLNVTGMRISSTGQTPPGSLSRRGLSCCRHSAHRRMRFRSTCWLC